jgi:hypothetical protein
MAAALFDRLRQLELPPDGYAIFGSGPLAIRKIISSCNDLDVLCKPRVWSSVLEMGDSEYLPRYDVTIVHLPDCDITFGTSWGIGEFDIEALIDGAETIDSLPFVRIEHVIAYKKIRSSAKDLAHLDALRSAGHVF